MSIQLISTPAICSPPRASPPSALPHRRGPLLPLTAETSCVVRRAVAGEATPHWTAWPRRDGTARRSLAAADMSGPQASAPIDGRDGRDVVGEAAPRWGREGTGSSAELGRDVYRRKDEVRQADVVLRIIRR
jgi:hypothetical protein